MVKIFGSEYKSLTPLLLNLGLSPRSKKYLIEQHGSLEGFFRKRYPGMRDSLIKKQLDKASKRVYYVDKSKYFFINDLRLLIKNNIDAFSSSISSKHAAEALMASEQFSEDLKKYLNKFR